ncbi:MAG: aspartate racemase [Anaerolineaceae bacterium]|nr:aspartate racemase [Anaerolineaceae bacterium]
MKTIGLIGGMSWESSLEYYRLINQSVKNLLGGLHSAQCLMYSVDFAEVEVLQHAGEWEKAGQMMAEAAIRLELGGADFIVICTNTMHKLASYIQEAVDIPLLHITDATAAAVLADGIKRIGLLGTRFTMEEDFYRGRLEEKYGLEVIIPSDEDRNIIHQVIYDELCLGQVKESSGKEFQRIIRGLETAGAQGVILGCTEIGLLIKQKDSSLPVYDTTVIHAEAAVRVALGLMDESILS